ncbi:MAG: DNA alkylation repair protein [candidate division WOR-3 bacterium]|nr:MAG: DNA alkylation repair protein [candidate division WOR-3 bacterium]
MPSARAVIKRLRDLARPDQLEGMARFGIVGKKRLGVSIPDLRRLAKEIGKDHRLAIRLWRTSIPDAMILASMIDESRLVTDEQMEDWVKDFNSWDVCDQVCMNLFDKSPLAWKKVRDWSERGEEFVKRAGYALLACLAWHDKKTADKKFTNFFAVIKRGATDERNYVKKAVNWALRNIGKRNSSLNTSAIKCAEVLLKIDSPAARWIARDALRELQSESLRRRLPRQA